MNDLLLPAIQKSAQDLDPYYNLVSLHLKGDVNTGRNYNAFSDASSNNFRLTNNGDVRGSSFSPYGTSWSGFFDGNGDYLSIPNSANLNTTGDFTIEGWAYLTSVSAYGGMFSMRASTGTTNGASITFLNTGYIEFAVNPGGQSLTTPTPLNQWFHVALVRSGSATNNCSCYLNGTRVAQFTSASEANGASNGAVIGRYYANGSDVHWVTGYLSNVRYVVGTAVYSGATITVPTAPLTAISGTQVLTCHANRFIDRDGAAGTFAITRNGETRISSFSPFLETDTTSGSGYFDGSGDYLSIPGNSAFAFGTGGAGTGDFCLETWVYPNTISTATFDRIVSTSDYNGSGFDWTLNTNSSSLFMSGTSYGIPNVITKAWNHIVYTRSSGVLRGFLNGVLVVYNASVTTNVSAVTELRIGVGYSGSHYNGYINGLRILKGSVPEAYQTSSTTTNTQIFTPPITSISAVTNTQLLTLQERGAYNTIGFQDESEYQHVITRPSGANVAQGTFSPFSNAGWSGYFDGTTDFVSTPTGQTNLTLGTSDFTIEGWFYIGTQVQTNPALFTSDPGIGLANTIMIQFTTSSTLNASLFVNNVHLTASSTNNYLVSNQWNHIAVCRTGGSTYSYYINGVAVNNVASNSTSLTTNSWRVGYWTVGANAFTGNISNFRIIKGTALYSGATITVPTAPLTAVANTQLLILQDNRFIDRSPNNYTLTITGDVRVIPFSPFKPIAYDPAVHGGSGYFDGTGDYLEMPYNPAFKYGASQDFCLEFWAYATTSLTAQYVISQVTSNNWGIIIGVGVVTSGRMGVTYGNGSTASTQSLDDTAAFPIGQWVHVVLCRTSGTIALFINGTRRSSVSNTNAINLTGDRGIRIGAHQDGAAAQFWPGYISGMRSIQNSNPYDATLTTLNVPSVPPSVVGNTSFLLNFTNGGVIDSTGKNVFETYGNAGVVTTTIKKYGTGSMYFDGTGDYLFASPSQNFSFGTGDFTIEAWFYTAVGTNNAIFQISNTAGGFHTNYTNTIAIGLLSGKLNLFGVAGTGITSTGASYATSSWVHVALVRSSGITKLYLNGTLDTTVGTSGSITDTTNYTMQYIIVGGYFSTSYLWNGYIDDLRITRGLARYTANFTAPTKALPDRGTASTLTTSMAAPSSVEALVVAGGASGGRDNGSSGLGGGGGAGGLRELVGANAISVSAGTNYAITIGAGGASVSASIGSAGNSGSGSTFASITTVTGGGGAAFNTANAGNGGSGGGGDGTRAAGKGIYPGSTYVDAVRQGYDGGSANWTGVATSSAGGGGGAGGAGGNGSTNTGGNGGVGAQSSITGVPTYYGGGGGGSSYSTRGQGGSGGGGAGGVNSTTTAVSGDPNTGGGGGGGGNYASGASGAGGSGVVILAYPTSFRPLKASLGLVYTIDTVTRPGYRVYKFTAGTGTISW